MFKLVVLSALFAVSMAAPGVYSGLHAPVAAVGYGLHGVYPAAIGYGAPAVVAPAAVAAVPTAVSHQSRVDVVSKPVVQTTYSAAPVAVAASSVYAAAPAVAAYAAPAAVAVPSAVSHQSRVDVVSKPVIATTYAAAHPVISVW